MPKKMLIDAAHEEEVRVCVMENGKVDDFDFESSSRKPLRGNIYLARVTRVEPSLQAAFVEFGGNRHGFLAFNEIHPDYYQIPVSDREELQAAEAEEARLAAALDDFDRQDDEDDDRDRRDEDAENFGIDRDDDEAGDQASLDEEEDTEDSSHEVIEDISSDGAVDGDIDADIDDIKDSANGGDEDLEETPELASPPANDEAPSAETDEQYTDEEYTGANDPLDEIADAPAQEVGAQEVGAQANYEQANSEEDNDEQQGDTEEDDDDADPNKRAPLSAKTPPSLSAPVEESSEDANVDNESAQDEDSAELANAEGALDDAVVEDETETSPQASDSEPSTEEFSTPALEEENIEDAPVSNESEEIAELSASENDDEDGEKSQQEESPQKAPSAKSARAKRRAERDALYEQYKEARRNRARIVRNYKIQEVIKRRQILLIQVVKEERGNKGAALTTYLSLAGRYCVLMPNTARGGGISRKIPSASDRKRLRRVVDSLDVPQGMGLIIRTAGAKRTKIEIKRDYDYLTRLWENIRSLTLNSIAPCLIYEEASLIKRAIRDLYDKEISMVYVAGEEGYREAKDFMKMLMPSHAKNVQPYKEKTPIFVRYDVETQLDAMYQPVVKLKSGGYIVINQTEALIAIDVNSGKATRERNIELTALRTNQEAAEETARQCRLRDLAGLLVIDFIDMEEHKNNRAVERRLKEALKKDRARIQVGKISGFGLLEMSRQRRRSGIVDGTTQLCPTCNGAGAVRSPEMSALRILRAIESEAIAGRAAEFSVSASLQVTLYILNHKRNWLQTLENDYAVSIEINADASKAGDQFELEKRGTPRPQAQEASVVRADTIENVEIDEPPVIEDEIETSEEKEDKPNRKRRRRRRRKRDEDGAANEASSQEETSQDSSHENGDENADDAAEAQGASEGSEDGEDAEGGEKKRRRRRGRRGGRRKNKRAEDGVQSEENAASDASALQSDGQSEAQGDAQPDDIEAVTSPDVISPNVSDDPVSVTPASPSDAGAKSDAFQPASSDPLPEPAPYEQTDEPAKKQEQGSAPSASEHDTASDDEARSEEASAGPSAPTADEIADRVKNRKSSRKGWWSRVING